MNLNDKKNNKDTNYYIFALKNYILSIRKNNLPLKNKVQTLIFKKKHLLEEGGSTTSYV